ncbi:MAG: GntR family transcriptional regulator [Xanthobacteraceae bacterium]|jgi:GntR family transcriptional regulator, rspAB operon transcriptional repressor
MLQEYHVIYKNRRASERLSERAYEAIKERILSLDLRPGQFVNEQGLCAMVGMGRMPVHQAVHRLMTDGLLEIMPRKGIIIGTDSLNDVLTGLEARSVLEPHITALAADRARPEQIEAMERVLAQSRRIVDQRFRREFMELDRRFHQAVAEASGNHVLVDVQRPLHERSARIWSLIVMRRADGLRLTQEEHEAVLEAIKRRDQEAARQAMQDHLASLRRRVKEGADFN